MVRKRVSVSDLIQEEAQKFTPSGEDTAIEITAEAVVESHASPTAEVTTQPPPAPTAESTATKRVTPTKADLELTIQELKATLEKSQQQEAILQKQIDNLNSSISEEKSLVERLTKELDQTKKTALQLAESNSQLIEENNALKQEQEKFTEANKQLTAEINSLQQPKAAIKPHKEPYNSLSYRKSDRTPTKLPPTQPDASEDNSSQMWLLD